jgi:UDP-hydrolysing UDP-N-acetyl-D-glucosamine 2-epimerase
MKKPRKIVVVVTARATFSRIRTALHAIKEHPELELHLILAASVLLDRFGSAAELIEADGFTIAAKVFNVLEGSTPTLMAKNTGIGIVELATAFDSIQPDIVVTVADRYETMATALAASYMNIPLAHVQGGEVTGSIDEKVRHAITKLADVHLVSTELAAERVARMGEERERIHHTGCPSIDLAKEVLAEPGSTFDPFAKYGGVGANLDLSDGYLMVLQHPVTTEHEAARSQAEVLLKVIHERQLPTIWFWPNIDAGSDSTSKAIRVFREHHPKAKIHFFRNVDGRDFLRLLKGSRCLIGNSSVGVRECGYLGVPVVNIGSRQQGRERSANVMDVPHFEEAAIASAIDFQLGSAPYDSCHLYGEGQSGKGIADVLAATPLIFEKRLTY